MFSPIGCDRFSLPDDPVDLAEEQRLRDDADDERYEAWLDREMEQADARR